MGARDDDLLAVRDAQVLVESVWWRSPMESQHGQVAAEALSLLRTLENILVEGGVDGGE